MNKFVKTSLLIISLLFTVTGCDNTDNVSVEKEMSIDTSGLGVEGCGTVGPFNVSFNLEDYATIEDEPNINKARIALLFAANICNYSQINVSGAVPLDQAMGYVRLFARFELEDIRDYVISSNSGDADTSYIQIAHHFIKTNKKKYDIVFCSVIDSSILSTWESNTDVGYDNESYYSKAGQCVEWTEKENHKGFDVSANRTVTTIEEYLSSIKSRKTPQILYLFGHSRGGAISNLAAKKLIDKGHNVVAYTMASPLTTTSSEASNPKYNHIFNYVNAVDTFTHIPSADWGFKRYGQDIHFDIRNYKEAFKQYTGLDLPEYEDSSIVETLLNSTCESRELAYVFDEKYTLDTSKELDDQAAVDKYIENYKKKFSTSFESLQSYVRFDVTTVDGKFVVKAIGCPALLSQLIGIGIAAYSLKYAFSTLALQYYSIISVYAKVAGIDNVMSLKDSVDTKSITFAHFYQSYGSYFFA